MLEHQAPLAAFARRHAPFGNQPAQAGDGLDADAHWSVSAARTIAADCICLGRQDFRERCVSLSWALADVPACPTARDRLVWGRPLLRLVERSFWTLNSLVIEPSYAATREGLQQLVEQLLPERTAKTRRSRIRAATAAAAGILICALALLTLMLAWPGSRWIGAISDLASPLHLAPIALSNGVVLLAVYLAVIALVWALGDATMSQPRDFHAFYTAPETGRRWRVAHLSDLHVVGERYGFRIESGRSGPRGNERLKQVLGGLAALHGNNPLDAIFITGDMTDAGRSAEWAEFLDALALYPGLAERTLVLPGNHDLNVVDRANPARLDLPTSPSKRLRQIRTLSVMDQLQGRRVRVVDHAAARLGGTLADVLEPHRAQIAEFADAGHCSFPCG